MNARILLSIGCAAAVFPNMAFASKPPVKVEVIVDGDEEDFFDQKPPAPDGVRGRAQEAFDELEATEGVKVKTQRKKTSDGATQVVNVIVQGAGRTSQAQSAPADPAPADPPTSAAKAPPVPAVPLPPAAQVNGAPPPPDCDCEEPPRRRSWWRRVPSHVQKGDLLVSTGGGWGSAGGLFGVRVEHMTSQRWGLFLRFAGTGLEQDEIRGDAEQSNFLTRAEWGVPAVDPAQIENAFGYIGDFGAAWHWFPNGRFDFFPTFGVSHFGYDLDLRSAPSVKGGSVLVRAGFGFNYHWRRLFAGFDFAWYPYEIARYELVQNEDGDREAQSVDVEDRFNGRRFISTAHIGLRF
ncbi:MAG: hypothetical protein AAF449_05980 [Myxococcota bacterium]